jgi:hypothetical protein
MAVLSSGKEISAKRNLICKETGEDRDVPSYEKWPITTSSLRIR